MATRPSRLSVSAPYIAVAETSSRGDEMRSLLDPLKRRTLWQVLAIYLGGSWVLLQIVDLFVDNLGLPEWVFPASILLLLLGLPIVLATLFIQYRLSSTGEVADDVHEKLFTWRNALLGGAMAFLLLFGFAGLYVVVKDRGAAFGPAEAVADEALPGIAILPFSARGPDAEMWREGVMDVLSTNMEGISGIRAISPGTTLARWAELAPESGVVDEATEARIARPGKPVENAFIESFNGRLRQECLNQHWFLDLDDARRTIEVWRIGYNTKRPHSGLGGLTPAEFVKTRMSENHTRLSA